MPLSAKPYAAKKFADIDGRRMAYIDAGAGAAIVFQHGNPTSSYLWRNVMPHCAGLGRLVACDLIGMGDSDKLAPSGPDRYSYAEQRDYLFALWDKLALGDRIVLVAARLGLGAGLRVGAPQRRAASPASSTWRRSSRRSPGPTGRRTRAAPSRASARRGGEDMILAKNMFVERVLPGSILRKLADEEMAEYRRPFATPGEDRRPTLTWPRQIPIDGEPADVVAVVEDYSALAGRAATSRNCSSTPIPARSWSAASARSAAPGPTRPRSPSRASTSSRRTAPTRSAAPSPPSSAAYAGVGALRGERNTRPCSAQVRSRVRDPHPSRQSLPFGEVGVSVGAAARTPPGSSRSASWPPCPHVCG